MLPHHFLGFIPFYEFWGFASWIICYQYLRGWRILLPLLYNCSLKDTIVPLAKHNCAINRHFCSISIKKNGLRKKHADNRSLIALRIRESTFILTEANNV